MVERFPQQVVAVIADRDDVPDALHRAHGPQRAAHVFQEDELAPGRSTRRTSPTARRSSGTVQRARVQTTVSKLSSGKEGACASPTRKSTCRPSWCAHARARASMAGL